VTLPSGQAASRHALFSSSSLLASSASKLPVVWDNTSFPNAIAAPGVGAQSGMRCSGTAESPRSFPSLPAAQDVAEAAGGSAPGAVPAAWRHRPSLAVAAP